MYGRFAVTRDAFALTRDAFWVTHDAFAVTKVGGADSRDHMGAGTHSRHRPRRVRASNSHVAGREPCACVSEPGEFSRPATPASGKPMGTASVVAETDPARAGRGLALPSHGAAHTSFCGTSRPIQNPSPACCDVRHARRVLLRTFAQGRRRLAGAAAHRRDPPGGPIPGENPVGSRAHASIPLRSARLPT